MILWVMTALVWSLIVRRWQQQADEKLSETLALDFCEQVFTNFLRKPGPCPEPIPGEKEGQVRYSVPHGH